MFRVTLGPPGGIFGVFLDLGVFLVILKYYWQYFLFDWSRGKGRSNNRVKSLSCKLLE